MSRQRTGTAFKHRDHYDIQITLPNGDRSNPRCLSPEWTRAQARAEAKRLSLKAASEGWTKPRARTTHDKDTGDTFDVYVEKWLATRRDPKDPKAHLRFHVLTTDGKTPLLMNRRVTEITKADVEKVVADLDRKVREGLLSWKSALNVWGTLSKLLDDATRSKRLELRVLESNPAADVRGPDRGEEKQSSYLFPKEAIALLDCGAVPMRWRLAYALAMYTGLRGGELAVLQVGDVVLDGNYLTVHKARDRVSGGTKSTKGKRARRVPIEEHLRPLLEDLARNRPAAAVLVDIPPKQKIAQKLRKHLELAGVDREELHADDEHRRPVTFHDLRHTFATWLALRGATSDIIKGRLGHADLEMTFRYIAEAEAIGRGNIGEPFGPLPASLFGSDVPPIAVESQPIRRNPTQVHETMRGGRDSKEPPPLTDQQLETLEDPPIRRIVHARLGDLKLRALDSGDLALAKMVHRWEGELLAEPAVAANAAEVIDLGERRRERDS